MIKEWILRNVNIHVPAEIMTVFFLLFFVGALWFAYAPHRRKRHERMSLLPLEDDDGTVEIDVPEGEAKEKGELFR